MRLCGINGHVRLLSEVGTQIQREESLPAVIKGAVTISSIKSRKETIQSSPLGTARSASAGQEETGRTASHIFVAPGNSGNKRQRIVTPTPSKTINMEDSRASPSSRQASYASPKLDGQTPRRVLSNLTNV